MKHLVDETVASRHSRRFFLGLGLSGIVSAASAQIPTTFPQSQRYAYDALGRLVGVGRSGGSSVNYSYDKAGNRTSVAQRPYVGTTLTSIGFDPEYYRLANPGIDWYATYQGLDPYAHYLLHGWREGRDPNGFFSVTGYLNAYVGVRDAGIEPLAHYDSFGWSEYRDPSGLFGTLEYFTAYPAIEMLGLNPLVHYLRHGVWEGRSAFGDGSYRPLGA